MDHIFFHLFPTSVGTVQSVPSANAYLLFASAGADQGESNDAEDNVAKVDVASLSYLWKLRQYFWISLWHIQAFFKPDFSLLSSIYTQWCSGVTL